MMQIGIEHCSALPIVKEHLVKLFCHTQSHSIPLPNCWSSKRGGFLSDVSKEKRETAPPVQVSRCHVTSCELVRRFSAEAVSASA